MSAAFQRVTFLLSRRMLSIFWTKSAFQLLQENICPLLIWRRTITPPLEVLLVPRYNVNAQVHLEQLFQRQRAHQQEQQGRDSRAQRKVKYLKFSPFTATSLFLYRQKNCFSSGLPPPPTPQQQAQAAGTQSVWAPTRTWQAWATTRAAAWWPPRARPAGGAMCPCLQLPLMELLQHLEASPSTEPKLFHPYLFCPPNF